MQEGRRERERKRENINDGDEESMTISSHRLPLLTALHTALPAHEAQATDGDHLGLNHG